MTLEQLAPAPTQNEWITTVLNDFTSFLKDHADWERRSSKMAMALVARYPHKEEAVPPLIDIAVNEMKHFQQVQRILARRKVPLNAEMSDNLYQKQLTWQARQGRETRFFDHVIIAAVSALRAAERYGLIAKKAQGKRMAQFYDRLSAEEQEMAETYLSLLEQDYSLHEVAERLEYFLAEEEKVLNELELRPALH